MARLGMAQQARIRTAPLTRRPFVTETPQRFRVMAAMKLRQSCLASLFGAALSLAVAPVAAQPTASAAPDKPPAPAPSSAPTAPLAAQPPTAEPPLASELPLAAPIAPPDPTAAPTSPAIAPAPSVSAETPTPPAPKPKKHWYEKLSLRGYTQLRYNATLAHDGADVQVVGDSSVATNNTFALRRARITISGDVSDRLSVYMQPEFASPVGGVNDTIEFAQIRDWYADLYFDKAHEFRIRAGQSKVPFGWENMQSSQTRLALDRSDATNSAVKNERDVGTFFYWTPKTAQHFFKKATDDGLKGSGNYGVLGAGVYAGQGGSLKEQNDNVHAVVRGTLPLTLRNGQMLEFGLQGYVGKYVVASSKISPLGSGATIIPEGTLEAGNRNGIRDMRAAATLVVYPQPIGFVAEWNIGKGPMLNDAQTAVEAHTVHGGYATAYYRHKLPNGGELWPFVRYNYYRGGYKTEKNAPNTKLNELELGLEWQITPDIEIVGQYTYTDRTNTAAIGTADKRSYEQFNAHLARFQLQFRY